MYPIPRLLIVLPPSFLHDTCHKYVFGIIPALKIFAEVTERNTSAKVFFNKVADQELVILFETRLFTCLYCEFFVNYLWIFLSLSVSFVNFVSIQNTFRWLLRKIIKLWLVNTFGNRKRNRFKDLCELTHIRSMLYSYSNQQIAFSLRINWLVFIWLQYWSHIPVIYRLLKTKIWNLTKMWRYFVVDSKMINIRNRKI